MDEQTKQLVDAADSVLEWLFECGAYDPEEYCISQLEKAIAVLAQK